MTAGNWTKLSEEDTVKLVDGHIFRGVGEERKIVDPNSKTRLSRRSRKEQFRKRLLRNSKGLNLSDRKIASGESAEVISVFKRHGACCNLKIL